jgi:hypothetical protein
MGICGLLQAVQIAMWHFLEPIAILHVGKGGSKGVFLMAILRFGTIVED